MIKKPKNLTDWDKIIPRRNKRDSALPRPEDWSEVQILPAEPKKPLYIRLDADVLEWYRSKGKGYQPLINAVLRSYMEAKQES
jgi:uncharacterized protein (DUF4415 family)